MPSKLRPVNKILLIDDDTDDCDVFTTAIKDVSSAIQLHCLNQSIGLEEALKSYVPDLIFLDINMPMVDGFHCLKQLQESKQYSRIPIVMYSSTLSQKEINAAYGFGATLFFRKPTHYADLLDSLRSLILMDWEKPEQIKQQYFHEGRYTTFN